MFSRKYFVPFEIKALQEINDYLQTFIKEEIFKKYFQANKGRLTKLDELQHNVCTYQKYFFHLKLSILLILLNS